MTEIIRVKNIDKDIEWNEFLRNQYNLFFDQRFISYNDVFKKKIKWHHLMFRPEGTNKILAVMTGCERDAAGKKYFVSCDGLSYGGFLWKRKTDLITYFEVIESFKIYLAENKFNSCIIRNPPFRYNNIPNEETDYALMKEGFDVTGISLTNIIDVRDFNFKKISGPKKRSIKKSSSVINVELFEEEPDKKNFREFYDVLLRNRELKNVKPTHSFEELIYLKNKLENEIILFTAKIETELAAVCVLFKINSDMILNFYLAGDEKFKMNRVSEFLLYKSIEWSKENGYNYYDIGTSDMNGKLLKDYMHLRKNFSRMDFSEKLMNIKSNN
ncbi:MAG: GNAT family N-acetyltransferase [Ignavibacteria bacterium]|nr:GNAT family N-acetyltransferase [Ignavibacteria bacterium]